EPRREPHPGDTRQDVSAKVSIDGNLVRRLDDDSKGAKMLKPQSAVERRSAEAVLRGLIAKFSPAHLRLVGALRRWLQRRLPTAHEVVYEYRDCFVISYSPSEHGYEGVLAIRGSADAVKLYFSSGKGLPDPEKLLQGAAKA